MVASVELKGLGKRYGNAVAVEDVSLLIGHGQLVCLLGPSGCGKTTTLRLIAGFIEPAAGEIIGGSTLATTGRSLAKDESVSVSIRQHEIEMLPAASVAANVLRAVVTRQVFLGAARDYTVALDDKTELRVTAPPAQDIAPGQDVW